MKKRKAKTEFSKILRQNFYWWDKTKNYDKKKMAVHTKVKEQKLQKVNWAKTLI